MAVLGTAAFAEKKAPLVLKPSSPWTLDYAPERCSLSRHFGDEDEGVALRIDRYGLDSASQVLLVGKPVPRWGKPVADVSYSFSSDRYPDITVRALMGRLDGLPAVYFPVNLGLTRASRGNNQFTQPTEDSQDSQPPPTNDGLSTATPGNNTFTQPVEQDQDSRPSHVDAQTKAQVGSLIIYLGKGPPLDLQIGDKGKPLRAMQACIDNLIKSWGLDPVTFETESRTVAPKSWTIQKIKGRYPSDMARGGISAFVPVRVMVDAKGEPTKCVVQVASVNESFKHAICNSLARPFTPALDAQGKPVASVFQENVTYLM